MNRAQNLLRLKNGTIIDSSQIVHGFWVTISDAERRYEVSFLNGDNELILAEESAKELLTMLSVRSNEVHP